MNTQSKPTNFPNNKIAAGGGFDHRGNTTQNQVESQAFSIQTGVQAGGFFDRFYAWAAERSEYWNRWDRNTGVG